MSVPKTSAADKEADPASDCVNGRDEKALLSMFLRCWIQQDSAEVTGNPVVHVSKLERSQISVQRLFLPLTSDFKARFSALPRLGYSMAMWCKCLMSIGM